ncbi:unnamed protein product [Urochloa humidicola]
MGELAEPEAAMAAPEPSSCLTLRVFYLRVSRCEVDESMLDTLTLTHTPLTPDTDLQVMSGADQKPSSISSGGTVSCSLRRDRVDASSQEATFVSTEAVRMSGSVRFEVHSKDERIMVGDPGDVRRGGEEELGDEVPSHDAARVGVPEVRRRRGEAAGGGGVRRRRVPEHADRVHEGDAAAVQAAAPGEAVHGPHPRVRRAGRGHERNASEAWNTEKFISEEV